MGDLGFLSFDCFAGKWDLPDLRKNDCFLFPLSQDGDGGGLNEKSPS